MTIPSCSPFRFLAVLATGAGLALPPPPAAAQGPERPEVLGVEFRGNRTFSSDSLAAALEIQETHCRTTLFQFFPPLCPLGFDFAFERRYLEARSIRYDSLRVKLYYVQRGFQEVQVDTSLTRVDNGESGVRITFGIEEGRPVLVNSLSFRGLDEVPERPELLRALPVEEGDRLSTILLEATRDTIVGRLRDRGYPNADVLINRFIPRGTYDAEVDFDVYTGPRARFGPIVFDRDTAGTVLSERSLRRMLPFEEGDVYSKALVYEAQRNLFGLEIIRNASIQENLTFEPDTLVPVTVRVAEGDEHRVRTGGGWSTADCFNVESTWASRNFMGGARRLQVRGRVSNLLAPELNDTPACSDAGQEEFARLNWLVSVELFQPWLLSTRNSLTLSVFAERQSLKDVFVRKAVGITGSITRNLGVGTSLSLSYRPQLSTLDAAEVFFCTSFLVCTPEDVQVLQDANWLSPVGLTVSRNRTDNLLNPADGYQALVDVEHASSVTGSDFTYNRMILEGSWYQEMARRTLWAARIRMGGVTAGEFGDPSLGANDVVHPQKRFYAGGANSVRGFAQNRLGPRVLTLDDSLALSYRRGENGDVLPPVCTPEEIVALSCDPEGLEDGDFFPRPQGGTRLLEATLEYRFRIGSEFQAVLFADAGQVWAEGEALELVDMEVSPGMGVRYFSPIGPIRLDVGYRFRGNEALPVVTQRLRPFDPETDDPDARLRVLGPDLESRAIDWIELDDLALLEDRVLFGDARGFFRNLQIHLSIGQAF